MEDQATYLFHHLCTIISLWTFTAKIRKSSNAPCLSSALCEAVAVPLELSGARRDGQVVRVDHAQLHNAGVVGPQTVGRDQAHARVVTEALKNVQVEEKNSH